MKIFILIPAYNEKGNLEKLISSIEQEMVKHKFQFRLFFVIQGTDGSNKMLEDLRKKKPFLDFVYYKKPLGIGNAYKIGYERIDKTADLVLTMDADLNHDIADLPKFIKTLNETKSDIIIGSRFVKGGKFDDKRIWKKIVSRLTNKIITTVLGINLNDISSGFRLIKSETVKKVYPRLKNSGYPSYMEFILHAKHLGLKVTEIPITYHHRIWGVSKISSVKTLVDYILFMKSVMLNSFQHLFGS